MPKSVEEAIETIRQSGAQPRYVDPPPPNGINSRIKFWLTLIPIITILGSFAAGYGGGKYREGENARQAMDFERRLVAHDEEIKERLRKELYLEFLERYKSDQQSLEKEISEARKVRKQ